MNKPYVYKLTDQETGMWYIGCRTAKGCHFAELGVSYFTSSKYVEPLFRAVPERFLLELLVEHDDYDHIVKLESDILKSVDARHDPASYNCTNGDPEFNSKKCSILMWGREGFRDMMVEIGREKARTPERRAQLEASWEFCRSDESNAKIKATHQELARTPERRAQLEKAWAAAHTEEAKFKRSESMKKVHVEGRDSPEWQGKGSKFHVEKMKNDPEYAANFSASLRAGWVKRRARAQAKKAAQS